MRIGVYGNIPQEELSRQRFTSEGKSYDLNHNDELVVDMKYNGRDDKQNGETNSQGWERNQRYYFSELKDKHPEYFSEKNSKYIEMGKSPVVDARFVKNFPEYKGYENETLVHHHIGGDGQAVAIPKSMHKGFGEIHNAEKQLGITKNGQEFSQRCENYCKENASAYGKTSGELKTEMERERIDEYGVPIRKGSHENNEHDRTHAVRR